MRKLAAGRHPPSARHIYMEAGSLAEVQIVPEASIRPAGANDQAYSRAPGAWRVSWSA